MTDINSYKIVKRLLIAAISLFFIYLVIGFLYVQSTNNTFSSPFEFRLPPLLLVENFFLSLILLGMYILIPLWLLATSVELYTNNTRLIPSKPDVFLSGLMPNILSAISVTFLLYLFYYPDITLQDTLIAIIEVFIGYEVLLLVETFILSKYVSRPVVLLGLFIVADLFVVSLTIFSVYLYVTGYFIT